MNHEEEFPARVAAELDGWANVPTEDLRDTLSRRGACQWVRVSGEEPEWTGDEAMDRELAAPICAGCSVRAACLEYELRTAGYTTSGVWGPLDTEDRRRVLLAWLDRRDEGGQR